MNVTQEQLVEFKRHVLKVAKVFDAFCVEHKLRYFAFAGTAIGALRHKGIIPWDDDIDFVMPRPDYEKFLRLATSLLPEGFEVLSHQNNKEYHLQFAKMCDARTSLLIDSRSRCMMGAFVDIFPIDGLPNTDAKGRKKYFNDFVKIRMSAYYKRLHFHLSDYIHSLYRRDWKMIRYQLFSDWGHLTCTTGDPYDECDRISMAYPFDNSDYVAYLGTNHGPKIISHRSLFDDYYYVPFEDIQLRLPIGIDGYLRHVYGDNYMQLPPESKREARHSYYYLNLETRVSYKQAIIELKKYS